MAKKVQLSENDQLRMRVATIKATFPKGFDYTPIYQYEFGEQTKDELDRIRMVWNLRMVDLTITDRLEKISKHIQAK